MLPTPVSKAALRNYRQAVGAVARKPNTGSIRRSEQAMQHAYPIRHGTQVTTATVTFLDIGQPQHIVAPPHALPHCALLTRHWQRVFHLHC
jgi:hypothetical protein